MEALKTPALQVLSPTTRFGESAASRRGGHGVSFSFGAVFGGPTFRKQVTLKAAWGRNLGRERNYAGNSVFVAASAAAVADHEAVATAGSSGTLYSVLGVECGGSSSAIKSAYRQMARRYHPDVCPRDERDTATQKFLEVRHAYEILSDPEKRAEYDYALMHPSSGNRSISRSWRTQGSGGASDAWRCQWEAQLSRFHRRESKKMSDSNSWVARMRRAMSEN